MQSVDIVLVEDNQADIVLVREALKDAKIHNELHVVSDGESAIRFLAQDETVNPDKIKPGLVLLDLYMPKKNGMEVLEFIKGDESLKTIPVVVMTSSQEESDIMQAYELQANCYITKPVDFKQLISVVKTIEDFWLSVVRLPAQRKT